MSHALAPRAGTCTRINTRHEDFAGTRHGDLHAICTHDVLHLATGDLDRHTVSVLDADHTEIAWFGSVEGFLYWINLENERRVHF